MTYKKTAISGVWIIEPKVFDDARGYFMEAFKQKEFEDVIGKVSFVQDNESSSSKGVLRGLHYQMAPYSQAKLVRVVSGCVLDVAVDIRKGSPTFGKYVAVELSGDNKRQLFIPKGFAHGFFVISDEAEFVYKCTDFYVPDDEGGILWNDPDIGIKWPLDEINEEDILLSEKDQNWKLMKDTETNF